MFSLVWVFGGQSPVPNQETTIQKAYIIKQAESIVLKSKT